MADYRPQPLDTSRVALDERLQAAVEFLARHMHEFWARRRIEEGWTHGARHDGSARCHPDLVPFEQLSDSSARFDRAAAEDLLKALLAAGYEVVSPVGRAQPFAPGLHPARMTLSQIVDAWRSWDREHPNGWRELYSTMGERAIDLGEYLLAFDILKVGLRFFPGDVRLRQLQAIAMARSGAVVQAVRKLDELIRDGAGNVESLGGLASASKILWEDATDAAQKSRLLSQALDQYERAYQQSGAYWVGINAATLAACRGDADKAARYARAVTEQCLRVLDELGGGRTGKATAPGATTPGATGAATAASEAAAVDAQEAYWPLATLGEAALVLGDPERAADYYGRAVRAAPGDVGRIGATRRNARLLLGLRGADPGLLREWLPLPRVVVFAGHMIDRADRAVRRFPAELEPAVRAALGPALAELDAGIGYSSAACGSDILFLEAMLDRGPHVELNVILPYDRRHFVTDCVSSGGADWERRLDQILADPRVRTTEVSKGRVAGHGIAYEYMNDVIYGIAAIRARQIGMPLAPLAVWNLRPGDARGGTASIVERWRQGGNEVTVIDIEDLLRKALAGDPALLRARPLVVSPGGGPEDGPGVLGAAARAARPPRSAETLLLPRQPRPLPAAGAAGPNTSANPGATEMRAILFADVVGFSRRPETEVPLFVEHFLRPVNALAASCPGAPVLENTWGDGLYLVFETVREAGSFALDLRDFVVNTDWVARGFSEPLKIRIALHVGPVYPCRNPLTRRADYLGAHVNRAARLEGVTPENEVYASQAFAAISFVEKVDCFTCEYVGEEILPKKFGTFPTYNVRPFALERRPVAI